MTDPTVAWLGDLEELRRLPQRYSRAIDARDIDAVAELFHPDGSVDGARGLLPVPEYLDGLRSGPRLFAVSMHVLGDPLIELAPGSDEGRMDTYAVVHQLRPPGAADSDLVLGIRYLDSVVRHQGRWVITYRQAVNLWTRTVAAR